MEDAVREGLPLNPTKGILASAHKLRSTLEWHVKDGGSTSMGTVLNYILARIYLLEGVKLSQRPLQDLRAVYTAEHAKSCGISYRNLAMIVSCLDAMRAERGSLPFGNEPRFADLASTMRRDAVRHHEENTAGDGAKKRAMLLKNSRDARYVMGLPQRNQSKRA